MNREQRRALAAETDRIVAEGRYRCPDGTVVRIAEEVAAAVHGTTTYPEDLAIEPGTATGAGAVDVTGESTLRAAARLAPDGPVAALNFASAKHPGGGYTSGASAQEESIARSSALVVALRSQPEFYRHHSGLRDARYTDRVIHSPAVPVFRDDDGALLTEPYPLSVLTSPAPNASAIREPAHRAQLPEILHRRAAKVLTVAVRHGYRRLVLGAWGCGVFANDPATVAGAFADLLGGPFARSFERVVFAVLDHAAGTPTRAAFERVLLERG